MRGVKTGICECCGKHFEYKGIKRRNTCSKTCSIKLYRERKSFKVTCLNPDCGKVFKTTSKGKKFCCGQCKNYYYSLMDKKPARASKKKLVLSNGIEVRDDAVGNYLYYYYLSYYDKNE